MSTAFKIAMDLVSVAIGSACIGILIHLHANREKTVWPYCLFSFFALISFWPLIK